jgi:hypothetical protein
MHAIETFSLAISIEIGASDEAGVEGDNHTRVD